MARFCTRCNRPLDGKGHRIIRVGEPLRDRGKHLKVPRIVNRGRGRVGIQRTRVYECRVAPAYDSPVSGATMRQAPYPQRIKAVNSRHVQEDRLDVG